MSLRGEVQLEVCGSPRSIAPTYQAIARIEDRLGVGIPLLLARALNGDARVKDIAVIVYEGLKGAGHQGKDGKSELHSLDEIGEDVLLNFGHYCGSVGEFLGNALGGGKSEKKADAPESR